MEEIQIEKLLVKEFLKMGKFKELKSYSKYKVFQKVFQEWKSQKNARVGIFYLVLHLRLVLRTVFNC